MPLPFPSLPLSSTRTVSPIGPGLSSPPSTDAKKERFFYLTGIPPRRGRDRPLDASEADCARACSTQRTGHRGSGRTRSAYLERLRGAFRAIDAAATAHRPRSGRKRLNGPCKSGFACYTNPVPDHAGPVYVRKVTQSKRDLTSKSSSPLSPSSPARRRGRRRPRRRLNAFLSARGRSRTPFACTATRTSP
jgi:hypothetical protein